MRSRTEAMRCEYSRDSEAIKLIRAAYERGVTFSSLGKKPQQPRSNSIGCKSDVVKTLFGALRDSNARERIESAESRGERFCWAKSSTGRFIVPGS